MTKIAKCYGKVLMLFIILFFAQYKKLYFVQYHGTKMFSLNQNILYSKTILCLM